MTERGGTTMVCVASGPSLTVEQCVIAANARRAGRCEIVVVNDTWARIPDADFLLAGDGSWWEAPMNDNVRAVVGCPPMTNAEAVRLHFNGEPYTHAPLPGRDGTFDSVERRHMQTLAAHPWIRRAPYARGEGLGEGVINMGGNTGYAAIGFAYLRVARRVLLVGYDMQRADGANQGKAHWFGDHAKPLTQGLPLSWVRRFDAMAVDAKRVGLEIVNCTITTALQQFPRMDLREALEMTLA